MTHTIRPYFIWIALALSLSACQLTSLSTGYVDPNLDEHEAHKVRQIFGTHCGLMREGSTAGVLHPAQATEVSVYAIANVKSPPGWRTADISYRGHRDNLYFNIETAQYLCGTTLWREHLRGARSTPLLTTPIL